MQADTVLYICLVVSEISSSLLIYKIFKGLILINQSEWSNCKTVNHKIQLTHIITHWQVYKCLKNIS